MSSNIPQPMAIATLLNYRWCTPISPNQIGFVPLTPAAELCMYIGQGTHTFADRGNGGLPAITTPIWGYGLNGAGPFTYPGPTLVATAPVLPQPPAAAPVPACNVRWINMLGPDAQHPFVHAPRDADASPMAGRYSVGHATVHLHGGHLGWKSDGHPVRRKGFSAVLRPRAAATASPSSIAFEYPNTQPGGATLWYHDHTMDLTAKNVYAGLAGGYLLRHPKEGQAGVLPEPPFEMPLIIQDRSFTADGQLLYADAAYLQARLDSQALGRSAIRNLAPPSPEFKGQAFCVNGKLWPCLDVERRAYRFRMLNGCNSRMVVLRLSRPDPFAPNQADTAAPVGALALHQIGGDGGLLTAPVALEGRLVNNAWAGLSGDQFLVLAPGERADVLVDFSACEAGAKLYLSNHALEATSPFGNAGDGASAAAGTEAVMQFRVLASPAQPMDLSAIEKHLGSIGSMPAYQPPAAPTHRYVLNEFPMVATANDAAAPRQPAPGRFGWKAITFQTDLANPAQPGLLWAGAAPPLTVLPRPSDGSMTTGVGAVPQGGPAQDAQPAHAINGLVELWELYNLSPDVHPIHLHLASFQVLAREDITEADVIARAPTSAKATPVPDGTGVDANERGWKDTVRANSMQLTRILVRFDDAGDSNRDYSGSFVWHCHLIEHEDMGMMRPLEIVDPPRSSAAGARS